MNSSKGECRRPLANQMVAELEDRIERYSRVPHYLMITGERGTGKTTIARKIHIKSSRSKKEFVNLNCASLTNELLESELFGYEKGAFTGAVSAKIGLFEMAAGGTLFLDEIGELSLGLQAKLLKAVEEGRIRRVGSNSDRPVDVRIITATSRNLNAMVRDAEFRPDLFDRLNILNIETVPLRFQKEKIGDLVLQKLNEEASAVGRASQFEISVEAVEELRRYNWSGNFRELLNFATRLSVDCFDHPVITPENIRRILGVQSNADPHIAERQDPIYRSNPIHERAVRESGSIVTVTFDSTKDDLDSIYLKAAGSVIARAVEQHHGNLRGAARTMRTTHSTISRILRKFNSDCPVHHDTQKFPMVSSANAVSVQTNI